MAFTTDLTLAEYQIIEPLIPKKTRTRPPIWTKHQILNGIFYQLVNGCKWADLPKDLPPTGTTFYWFNKWKKEGVWSEILNLLWVKSRLEKGKKRNAELIHIRLAGS